MVNIGTLICFSLGPEDTEFLEKEFLPVFNRFDLLNLPNQTACVRALIRGGQKVKPFTLETEIEPKGYDDKTSKK